MTSSAHAVSLKEALEQTYMENPVIQAERESLAAVDERVAQAVSEWRPTVTGDYSKGRQKISFGGAANRYTEKEALQLTFEQPIFDGFGSRARLDSAEQEVMAGRELLRAVEQEILLQAITSYMDVVRDLEIVDLSGSNVKVLNKQLGASQERFDVGEVTRTDVSQSQSRLSRSEAEQSQAAGALVASRATFKRVVGVDADEVDVPNKIPALPTTLDEALEMALKHNPGLKRAEFVRDSLEEQIWSNKSQMLPSASLVGSMRREEGAGVSGGSEFDNDTLVVAMNVPLYQAGAASSRVRETKRRYQEAKYDAMDARNEAIERMTRAWQSLETARASIRANEAAIDAADVALEGVKQEQQYGARTVLDVLDAEQELFASRVNLVRSRRNELVAAYTILSVLGWLTPERLGLEVPVYNPEEHFEQVQYKPFGF